MEKLYFGGNILMGTWSHSGKVYLEYRYLRQRRVRAAYKTR